MLCQAEPCGGQRLRVAVEADEPPGLQPLGDGQRMTAAAGGGVGIDAIGPDVQRFDTFRAEHGNMLEFHGHTPRESMVSVSSCQF